MPTPQPDLNHSLLPRVTSGADDIDVPLLAYFGVSVLWRAAVWRDLGEGAVDLGPYEAGIRRYLLGELPFPDEIVVWISVMKAQNPALICVGPHLHNRTLCHQFEMQVFGIRWTFFVGRRIDPRLRRMCTVRSPERFIYMSDAAFDIATHGMEHLIRTARIADNLR